MSEALRTPPCNFEAERALLGSILMNNRAYERVSDILRAEHFADPANGRLFELAAGLIEKGKQANPVTLKDFAASDDLLAAAGGTKHLAALATGAVTIINAADYGRMIYDLYLRRELIEQGQTLVNRAYEIVPDETAPQIIEDTESQLYALAEQREGGDFRDIGAAAHSAVAKAEQAYQRGGKLVGVDTGLRDLNKKMGGLHPSDLIILAGRSSMGKTAVATAIAYNAAVSCKTEGGVVGIFSLEMIDEQVANRVLAHLAGIDVHKIRNGLVSDGDIIELMKGAQDLASVPLMIDHTGGITLSTIRARCRRLDRQYAKQGGLKLVVIDYLQLITPARSERAENRVQEVSNITRGLKALAKELNVPVVALSQLSRAVEQREDKRPMLSDLRESGSIEQDADAVIFVFREEYYLERSEPQEPSKHAEWLGKCDKARNICELIIGKQRNGPIGTEKVHFNAETTWVSDLANDPRYNG